MNIAAWVIALGLAGGMAWGGAHLRALWRVRQRVARAWQDIDTLMRERHDALPRLTELARTHLPAEAETITRLIEARQRVDAARARRDMVALGPAETRLRATTARLTGALDKLPAVTGDAEFHLLRARLETLEQFIVEHDEEYNREVAASNAQLDHLPDALLARLLHYDPFPTLRVVRLEPLRTAVVPLMPAGARAQTGR